MINTRLLHMTLYCKAGARAIDLDHDFVLFTGEINTGKSTTLHLIDYCLGAKELYDTQALRKQFLSVTLELLVEGQRVIIERDWSARAMVTWGPTGLERSELVPIRANDATREIAPGVNSLSDLFFYLSGFDTLKVRKAQDDQDSSMIRLSFRDLMFYCFLQQRYVDSDFFRLDGVARNKSRDAIRFVCGYYSPRLSELNIRLEHLRAQRESNDMSVERLRQAFDEASESGSIEDLLQAENKLDADLLWATTALASINESYASRTHISDELRTRLRILSDVIDDKQRAVARQRQRADELDALRAEFVNLKYKTERSQVALTLLGDAHFTYCPQCTRELVSADDRVCSLCKADASAENNFTPEFLEAARQDLNARLQEVDTTIVTQQVALKREERKLLEVLHEKESLDLELSAMLKDYNADYLERFRYAEREKARLTGALSQVRALIRLYRAIVRTQSSNAELDREIAAVRKAIEEERRTLTKAQERVNAIQDAFKDNLLAVGVPGIEAGDRVIINTQTWFPRVYTGVDAYDYWDFDGAGSNGRRVLFAVNYALAVHQVAERDDLPLPSLLMLDTPTKDVSKDVNREIHDAMDNHLFEVSATSLAGTQLVVADSTFTEPPQGADVLSYAFTREDGLIPNYSE